jgi:tripartite-type tricarboxylate transporter receptor subunit TctC
MTRRTVLQALAAAAALALTPPAAAQEWPQKPVRIVVPFAAGGNTDTIARIVAERLAAAFGQQFLVENRVGAGGAIAAESVAKAPPDGYTLMVAAVAQIAIVPFIQKVGYDPAKDFAPISNIGTNPFVLGIHVSLPVKTLTEFVDYARANPGKLNYASGGNGSIGHLSGALFASRAGLDMTHVPYKGGAPAVADLVAGQVHMYFGNASELIQHSRGGRIRLLGVSSDRRAAQLPDVPAIAETYAGFRTITWNALFAPAGTPRPIIDRIAAEVQKAVRDPAVAERLAKIGVDPLGSTPAELAATMQADIAQWRTVIQAANIRAE